MATNKPTGFYKVSAGRWNPIYDTHLSFWWSLWSSAERWDLPVDGMDDAQRWDLPEISSMSIIAGIAGLCNPCYDTHIYLSLWSCWRWLWDKRGKIQITLARDSSRKFQIVTTQEAYHVKQNQYKPPKSEITTHQLKTNATESSTLTDTDQKFNRSNYQTSNMITKPI